MSAQIEELRAAALRLISRVPPSFQRWSAGRVADFKGAVGRAQKVVRNPLASHRRLADAVRELRTFWYPV